MWEGLKLSGEGDDETGAWLSEAIKDNTLEAVTDSSYMKDLYPNMNSCAFILKCSRSRGKISGTFFGTDNGSLLLSRVTSWPPSNTLDPSQCQQGQPQPDRLSPRILRLPWRPEKSSKPAAT
jgi:hypothetical protein